MVESQRTLTVSCPAGLCNRLRVLLSGLALAEASGRRFRMLWPRTGACAASFAELFEHAWPVGELTPEDPTDLRVYNFWQWHRLPDVLTDPNPHLALEYVTWLLVPARYPAHAALMPRCVELFELLTPIMPIRRVVDDFAVGNFRPAMIGVHLRRGDFVWARPDLADNTTAVLAAVDRTLADCPQAGIFLCTDEGAPALNSAQMTTRGGIRDIFVRRYGDRVIFTAPRSLDRGDVIAVQDALVDLLLLRRTDYFVGTTRSSFSEMARFGRDIPWTVCAGATPAYRHLERLAKLTGVYCLLKVIGRRHFAPDTPFEFLWRVYTGKAARMAQRIIGRRTFLS